MPPKGFKCKRCGRCCLDLYDAYETQAAPEDLARWQRESRHDVLAKGKARGMVKAKVQVKATVKARATVRERARVAVKAPAKARVKAPQRNAS